MTFRALLAELQGEQTQTEFSERLGVAQSYLSMVLAGKRRPGRTLVSALIREFPQQERALLDLFFAGDYRKGEEIVTNKKEDPA